MKFASEIRVSIEAWMAVKELPFPWAVLRGAIANAALGVGVWCCLITPGDDFNLLLPVDFPVWERTFVELSLSDVYFIWHLSDCPEGIILVSVIISDRVCYQTLALFLDVAE